MRTDTAECSPARRETRLERILLAAWFFAINAVCQGAPPIAASETFHGRWQKIVPLRHGVFSIAMGNQIMKASSETGRPEGSSLLLCGLDRLSPPILRLPGGDMLNRWSWICGRSLDSEGASRQPMRVDDFLKICRAAHAVALWGVNVASVEPRDTEFLARALAERGVDPPYFELGNELYLPQWAGLTRTAEIYAQKAMPHAQVLKKYFPKAKLGVPLASYRQLTSTASYGRFLGKTLPKFAWKKPAELDPWILGMARQTDYYDAVVLHLYLVPTELGKAGLAEHTADEVCRWAWIRSDPRQVRDLFGLVRGLFPTKDIWVTEWAFNANQYIGGKGGGNKDVRYQVHQTMLAVLYNTRFMLNTAYEVPYVPIMTIWTLYGQPATAILREGGPAINFEMFRMIRWAREGCDGLARLALSGAPVLKGPAGPQEFDKWESIGGEVFGFYRGDKLQSVMMLNVLPKPVSVEIPNLPEGGVKEGRALYSAEMLPEWGNPKNPGAAEWAPPYQTQKLGVPGNVVTVPANSLSVVHLSRTFQ
jgi:hypothetical protein